MLSMLLALAAGIPPANVAAAPCSVTTVAAVSRDGQRSAPIVLRTRAGARLAVLGTDFVPVAKWRRGERLRVCRDPGSPESYTLTDLARSERVVAIVARPGPESGRAGPCPQADPARLAPADLLDREDAFRERLSPADRRRLDAVLPRTANGRIAACADRDGTACDAHAYLAALRASGLMSRFQATICRPRD